MLGFSYKPDTPVVEDSQGVMLANRLAGDGFTVTVFDPAAMKEAPRPLAPTITLVDSLAACLDASDLVVVTVPWPEFREVPTLLRATPRPGRIILDCWRTLDASLLEGIVDLVYVGKAASSERHGAYASRAEKHTR